MKAIILFALVAFVAASPFSRTFTKSFPERIVGGTQARRGEFPYIVQIRRGDQYCGGTIVNRNWILTAAHCSLESLSGYTVIAGENNLNQYEGSEQFRTVVQIIRHPGYIVIRTANDVAVWRVNKPFSFNTYVQPIQLASYVPTGNVVAAGWGKLKFGGSLPTVLMKVTVPMVSDSSCKASYGSAILPGMICAGTGGRDSCQGDSGGPLVAGSNQVGIVSWGTKCALPGYPGVYASVSYYRSWIVSNTSQ